MRSTAETTVHIAQNYDTLPSAAKDLWDDYSGQIHETAATGDTFTVENFGPSGMWSLERFSHRETWPGKHLKK